MTARKFMQVAKEPAAVGDALHGLRFRDVLLVVLGFLVASCFG